MPYPSPITVLNTRQTTVRRERRFGAGGRALGYRIGAVRFKPGSSTPCRWTSDRPAAPVVFAVTVAYVLYPFRRLLSRWGLSRGLASTATTPGAFLVCLASVAPLPFVVYLHQEELVANLNQIPDTVTLAAVGIEYTVGVSPLLDRIV